MIFKYASSTGAIVLTILLFYGKGKQRYQGFLRLFCFLPFVECSAKVPSVERIGGLRFALGKRELRGVHRGCTQQTGISDTSGREFPLPQAQSMFLPSLIQ